MGKHTQTSDETPKTSKSEQIELLTQRVAELEEAAARREASEADLRSRNDELELLFRAGQAFVSSLDLEDVFRVVLEEVRQTLGGLACSAWLVDPDTGELVCRYVTDPDGDLLLGWRLEPGQGIAGWVVEHEQGLIVPDTRMDQRHYKGVDQRIGIESRSILAVPLRVQGRVSGVMEVIDPRVDRFTRVHMKVAETLAGPAATAIEMARMVEKVDVLRQFNQKMVECVAEAILAVDAKGLVTYANQQACNLLDTSLYELVGQEVNALFPAGDAPTIAAEVAVAESGGKVSVETTLRSANGRDVPVLLTASRFSPRTASGEADTPRLTNLPEIGNPVAVYAFAHLTPRAYAVEPMMPTVTMESSAGWRDETEAELRSRNAELELLYRAGQAFVSSLDLDEVFNVVLEEVRQTLGGVACSAWLVEPDTGELVCRYVTDPDRDLLLGWRLAPGQGIAGWVVDHNQGLIVPDTRLDDRHFKAVDDQAKSESRSILAVPLRVRDRVTGVVEVIHPKPDRFSRIHLRVAETLAGPAATAVEMARLIEKADALRVFNQSVVECLEEGILAADSRGFVTYANPKARRLLEAAGDTLLGRDVSGFFGADQWPQVAPDEVTGPYAQGPIETTMLSTSGREVPVLLTTCRLSLVAPIQMSGSQSVIGSGDPRQAATVYAFTDLTRRNQEEERLRELSGQEPEPARRIETRVGRPEGGTGVRESTEAELRSRNAELELLLRASQAFVSSMDLQQVFAVVLEEVRVTLGAAGCSAWLVDPDTDELVCRYVSDPKGDVVLGWRLAPGQGVAGWVVEHAEGVIVPDTRLDMRHFKQVDQRTSEESRSILAVPLRSRGRVIGVMEVIDARPNRFTRVHQSVAETLAGPAATAVEMARLIERGGPRGFDANVAECLHEGLLTTDGQGLVTYANTNAHKLLGAQPGALVDRELVSFFSADGLYLVEQELEMSPAGRSTVVETKTVPVSGKPVPVSLTACRLVSAPSSAGPSQSPAVRLYAFAKLGGRKQLSS